MWWQLGVGSPAPAANPSKRGRERQVPGRNHHRRASVIARGDDPPPTRDDGAQLLRHDGTYSPCSIVCYSESMSREISQRELRNESGKIMRELDEGETFIVTRNGVPVGELVPLRRHRFLPAEAAVELFRAAPSVDYRSFRADLDAAADQDPAPRG